ncbi:MAG: aminopeptidase [Thermoplasmata archaeon]|nr:aminopeptidase [Thermoplasmata archaeon]
MKRPLIWEKVKKKEKKEIMEFAEDYKRFLDRAKTEREAVEFIVNAARENGFVEYGEVKKPGPGTRFYLVNREKNVALVVLGKRPMNEAGINIVASHIDSPRLDLKQNPLYEDKDTGLAMFRTQYYGGLKKYQWASIPLALHGIVITSEGKKVNIVIGEKANDPVFTIPDLLPHLWKKAQADRKIAEGIKGEEMSLLVGAIPVADEKVKQRVKLTILEYLNRNYGIVEEDFISAEMEIVPAINVRDVGLDRSMIGAYGQDDSSATYASLRAIFEPEKPEITAMALFFDKEEIGSEGNTGVKSRFVENVVARTLSLVREDYRDLELRELLERSRGLSADVNAGVNPIFKDVHEIQNAAKLGYGIVLTKYTGSGGKYNASDANAEFVGEIRRLFNRKGVYWQYGAFGKVDEGGGGTVAKFLAEYNMEILDCGPPVLAMHSTFEVTSKADIWASYKAYYHFYDMK